MRPETPAIVVAAPPMGGASRLALALSAVSGARLMPEMNLFLADDLDGWRMQAARAQSDLGHGALRAIALANEGEESEAGVERAQQWLWRRGEQSPLAILEHVQGALGAVIWPDLLLGWRPDYLSRLRRADVSVVHVVRRPEPQTAALARRYQRQNFVPPVFRDFAASPSGELDPQLGWYQFHRNLSQLVAQLGVRYHRVHWEEFAARPEPTLRRCLHACGLRWQPTETPPLSLRGPASAAGGFDTPEFDDALFDGIPDVPPWVPERGFTPETLALATQLECAAAYQAL